MSQFSVGDKVIGTAKLFIDKDKAMRVAVSNETPLTVLKVVNSIVVTDNGKGRDRWIWLAQELILVPQELQVGDRVRNYKGDVRVGIVNALCRHAPGMVWVIWMDGTPGQQRHGQADLVRIGEDEFRAVMRRDQT